MDNKAAAIALTLIIAVPILLGYGLALSEEEMTAWQTSERYNLTDTMNNADNLIYVESTSPNNNRNLLATITYPGQGITETRLVSPSYTSVGTVYTSLPEYSTTVGYFNQTAATTTTTTGTDMGTYTQVDFSDADSQPYLYVTTSQLSQLIHSGVAELDTQFGPFVSLNDNYYGYVNNTLVNQPHFQIVSDRSPDYTIVARPYTVVPDACGDMYSFTLSKWSSVRLTVADGTYQYYNPTDYNQNYVSVARNNNVVYINDTFYNNIVNVEIAAASDLVTYYKTAATANYADPSYGWTTNVSPGNVVTPYWTNGAINHSTRMMMHIVNGEFVDIQPFSNTNTAASYVHIERYNDMTSVILGSDVYSLGNYSYLCVDVSGSSFTVSGLNAWPNMYSDPIVVNSVTVDLPMVLENYNRILLSGSSTIEYRVDSSQVLSGSYGVIRDYTLDMGTLWPSENYSLRLSQIGIYGYSITFAGNTYLVTDGTITVNGSQIRLLDAAISSTYDSDAGTWTNMINGVELSETASPSTVYFAGTWSMNVSAYKIEEITTTEMVWHPGEFAFNGVDASFALMGLLTCIAVFIGLGIYGRRSGAKVGTLMIICGCAAFIFLAMM